VSERRFFLDRGVGETRGVVLLDGRPERLILQREGDDLSAGVGAQINARVRKLDKALGSAFLELPGGAAAILAMQGEDGPLTVGQAVHIEIKSEARGEKAAVARFLGPGEGAPRLLRPALDAVGQLTALARDAQIVEGDMARDAADLAEAEALEIVHALPGGGRVSIEPTRALTAIDIDVGDRPGAESKRVTREANLAGLAAAARLLRLKGLGGLVCIDLAGRGHDGNALLAAARNAFGPDNPGVAFGPISRFGLLELTVPRRARPTLDRLLDETGAPSAQTLALRLARAVEREGRSAAGARLVAACAPAVALAFAPLRAGLAARLGERFSVESRAGWPAARMEVWAA
jgi:Ribonuclease G/E